MSLTVVLSHVGVYKLNDVGTDRCKEYSRKRGGGGLLSGEGEDGKYGASSHFDFFICDPQMRAGWIMLSNCFFYKKRKEQNVSNGL
jgi:hypothetical protein